ncbi:MAG: hypothetical protein HY329_03240 [Chloroflexi bacterium]|nr:hypothetical protein [Chloroflexota bacterium]
MTWLRGNDRPGRPRVRQSFVWLCGLLIAQLGLVACGASQVAAVPAVETGPEIELSTGGIHEIRHSTRPLPTSERPRPDGKLSLVWFSHVW